MDSKNICAALVKAQRAFGPALKTHTNPAFKSRYADLSACIEAVIDGLNSNGIALVQRQHPHDGGVCVETIFVHESGEQFSAGMLTVPASKQDPQGYGSALTYARRYSLMAACGIAPEDDDGNAAKKPVSASPIKQGAGAISATGEAYKSLSPDWQAWIDEWAKDVENTFEQQGQAAAQALIDSTMEKEQLDGTHYAALYSKLGSKTRSALKAKDKAEAWKAGMPADKVAA